MATIEAVVTDEGLEFLPQMWAGIVTFKLIDEFRVGEGGWITTASGQVPRTPDATLTDLDAVVNPGRYPADSLGTFTKALAPGDFSYDVPTKTLSATCLLDFGEFNDDGNGNNPQIYEIGLFMDHPTSGKIMVAYGTFPEELKTPGVQFTNTVTIAWGRP